MSSADSFCKQFGPRSGSEMFDILMVFLKEFFKKVDFEKNQQTTKSMQKGFTVYGSVLLEVNDKADNFKYVLTNLNFKFLTCSFS